MPTTRRVLPAPPTTLAVLAALLCAALLCAAPLGAQAGHAQTGHAHSAPASAADTADGAAALADARMAGPLVADSHLRLTPVRPAAPGDSARTATIERLLLPYLARYADVRDAERDGYAPFAPNVRGQRVLHYTSARHAVRAAFAFDPARPTSLLYREDERGRLVLAGAMYTAPAGASEEALHRRVPLSAARWHQHVAICVPKRGERARWAETERGRPRFGPAGTIATRADCEAAGGRFHERLFGWMVHANLVRTPAGPRIGWAEEHAADGHGGHGGH
jgi:hypothetical protein